MKIFELFGEIFIENDKADESLDKTDGKMKKLADGMGKGIATAGKWAAGIGTAAVAVGGAALAAADKFAQTTDRIDKMSDKLGLSREGFQEWEYILSQSGTEIEALQGGMDGIAKKMAEAAEGSGGAAEAFDALGISVTDASGELKSKETILEESVAALQAVANETERAALADELFGGTAAELAPLLNAGAGAVENMKNQARDMGLVMGDEAIDSGVLFADTMDNLKRQFTAVAGTLMADLMPMIQGFLELIMDNMPLIQDILTSVFGAFEGLIQAVLPLLTDMIEILLPPLIELLNIIIMEVLPPLIEVFLELAEVVLPLVVEVFRALMPIIEPIMEALSALIRVVLAAIKGDWEAVWEGIKDFLGSMLDAVIAAVEVFAVPFQAIFEAIAGVVTGIWDGMVNGIIDGINWVIEKINWFIQQANKIQIDLPGEAADFGINISEIPLLEGGGELMTDGRVIVGEKGKEMLTLPAGASVQPISTAGATEGGGSGGGVNQVVNIYSPTALTPSKVAKETKQASRRLALEFA